MRGEADGPGRARGRRGRRQAARPGGDARGGGDPGDEPYLYDPGTPDERIEEDLAIRLQTYPSRQGYMGQLQAVLSWSSYDRLPEITAPTLVLHGESDRLVPPRTAASSPSASPAPA
ncbi:MAG: hypothetical protein WCE71_07820 [Pseudonocardiaceae bacterium]